MKKRDIIITAIFLVILVPLGIDGLYKLGDFLSNRGALTYITEWDAADVLSYYGAVLGGAATLYGIIVTITSQNKHREKDRKKDKNEQRIQFVAGKLHDTLQNLDGASLLNSRAHGILIEVQALFTAFDRAHRCKTLDINFTKNEKEVLWEVLEELQNYAKSYSEILLQMNRLANYLKDPESNIDEMDSNARLVAIDSFNLAYTQIEKLYSEQYKDLIISVQKGMEKLEQHLLGEV